MNRATDSLFDWITTAGALLLYLAACGAMFGIVGGVAIVVARWIAG